ncbi:condensation domain-containing protein [Streptomyces sp. NPDC000410]|uniref:condensation domain-containing protein n=1 Tax=Streptomyces sp. NPDC000410 TaxID=3154254 RepID=UPI00332AF060
MTDGHVTAERRTDAAMTVVVDPGRPPHHVPPVLEVRGPLAPGRVAAALDHAATRTAGGRPWRHTLQRLGPDRHVLHVEPRTAPVSPGDPQACPDTFPAGLVADLLTARDGPAVPLAPAQLDLIRRAEDAPGHALPRVLNAAGPLDPAAVDAALRALARAHPLLGARVDTTAGGGMHAVPPVHTAECVDLSDVPRAREQQAVDAAARRLDPATGTTLCALLLRGRRRLVVVAHELVVDQASLDILMADLREALARPEEELAAEDVRYTDWAAAQPAVATDPRETDRWRTVAEGRAATRALRPRASLPDTGPHRHPGFALGRAATRRLTTTVPRRFGLTPAQLLTGAMGLALIRWRGTERASFDVCVDGRQGGPALARTVGPLAGNEPVLLDGGREEDARQFIDRVAASLADVGRGAFGACREHAPDPALRLALRELVPVLVRFTPDAHIRATGQTTPRTATAYAPDASALDASAPDASGLDASAPDASGLDASAPDASAPDASGPDAYALDADARIRGGRLRVGLDWLPAARDGVTEESAARLLVHLKDVLDELAGSTGAAPATTSTVAAGPLQRELLADADAHPGTGRQIEQLSWVWHGPLDIARLTAAWQSVFDRETVLRAAFDHGPDPAITIHDRVVPQVVRMPSTGEDRPDALLSDRRRGLDPRFPGPLRITLLDGPRDGGTAPPATRVLLTYHRALLDTWSVRLLVAEFFRAYLAGGTLPGGERRPDVRDYAHWIQAQDLAPARDFWLRSAPRPTTAAPVPAHAITSPAARGTGTGRVRVRLSSSEAARLDAWAARWGATESGALQAAWALLLYRAAGADGSVPVRFSVAVSGRGIPLEGVERLPGALGNALPVSVEVDPTATVPDLLASLRDQAIDLSSYEWVPAGRIHGWTGTAPNGRRTGRGALGDLALAPAGHERLAESLLVFESGPDPLRGLEPSFAAHGIRMEFPETTSAANAFPVTLVAHRDEAGGLVLSVIHDRARLADGTALLADCAGLLRELPCDADGTTTVAELLDGLSVTADAGPAFTTLRRGTGGVICLVPSPGVPRSCYVQLSGQYAGPETVILLRPTPKGPRSWHGALRPLAGAGQSLLLVAFSGGGAAAYETARLLAADGARTATAVLTDDTGSEQAVGALARLLAAAARRPGGPPDGATG